MPPVTLEWQPIAVSPAHAPSLYGRRRLLLVHNGSVSNPYSIRRTLEKRGVRFETDNDTEAAFPLPWNGG